MKGSFRGASQSATTASLVKYPQEEAAAAATARPPNEHAATSLVVWQRRGDQVSAQYGGLAIGRISESIVLMILQRLYPVADTIHNHYSGDDDDDDDDDGGGSQRYRDMVSDCQPQHCFATIKTETSGAPPPCCTSAADEDTHPWWSIS